MTTFGYSSGDGSGNYTFDPVGADAQWATRYVNTGGATVYVDTLTLLNVTAPVTVNAKMAIYADGDGGLFPTNLLSVSSALPALSAGSNAFTLGTLVGVAPGAAVWATLMTDRSGPVICSGAAVSTVPDRLATYEPAGYPTFAAFFGIGLGLASIILPATLSGSTTAPGTSDLREPIVFAEPLAEGAPSLREALVFGEPLAEGLPHLREALVFVEALLPVPPEPFMATDVFPALIGLTFDIMKAPEFNTGYRSSTSGRATKNAYMQYPWWNFSYAYDYLPDLVPGTSGYTDYRALVGFFLNQLGRFGTWLYHDPTDYHVVGGPISTADGVTLQWPFFRNFGSFMEPVGQVDFTTLASFLPAAINTGAHTITIPAHGFINGQGPMFFTAATTFPTPLAASTPYWVIVIDANTIQLAASKPLALVPTPIAISTQGVGAESLTKGFAIYETIAETDSVPGSPAYTITVAHAAAFIADGGVTLSGVPLVNVPSGPLTGQYSVDLLTGVYTFNSAQASDAVVITYTYLADPTNVSILMPNQLVFGVGPADLTIISADFDFYYVCEFKADVSEFKEFMFDVWDLEKLEFRSVIQ